MTTYPEMIENMKKKKTFYICVSFKDGGESVYGTVECASIHEAIQLANTIAELTDRRPHEITILKKKVWMKPPGCSCSWNTHLAMARIDTGLYERR